MQNYILISRYTLITFLSPFHSPFQAVSILLSRCDFHLLSTAMATDTSKPPDPDPEQKLRKVMRVYLEIRI